MHLSIIVTLSSILFCRCIISLDAASESSIVTSVKVQYVFKFSAVQRQDRVNIIFSCWYKKSSANGNALK